MPVTIEKKGVKYVLYVQVLEDGETVLRPAETLEEYEAAHPDYRVEIAVGRLHGSVSETFLGMLI